MMSPFSRRPLLIAAGAVVVLAAAPPARGQQDAGAAAVRAAVLRVAPKGVVATSFKERPKGLLVTGRAKRHDEVADFARSLATVASTPRGLGRVLERSAERGTVRVELIEAESPQVDFAAKEVSNFVVDLRRVDRTRDEHLEFEIDVHGK
ncbi:MAG: PilN domain-containing protein [Archangium sp.]|nr:PilN domain-containing protein [Archangium sp.]